MLIHAERNDTQRCQIREIGIVRCTVNKKKNK